MPGSMRVGRVGDGSVGARTSVSEKLVRETWVLCCLDQ